MKKDLYETRIGKRYGSSVITGVEFEGNRIKRWTYKCDCGYEGSVPDCYYLNNRTNCTKCNPSRFNQKYKIGDIINGHKVVEIERYDKGIGYTLECCDCGKMTINNKACKKADNKICVCKKGISELIKKRIGKTYNGRLILSYNNNRYQTKCSICGTERDLLWGLVLNNSCNNCYRIKIGDIYNGRKLLEKMGRNVLAECLSCGIKKEMSQKCFTDYKCRDCIGIKRYNNLIGKRIFNIEIIGSDYNNKMLICKCDCGNEFKRKYIIIKNRKTCGHCKDFNS